MQSAVSSSPQPRRKKGAEEYQYHHTKLKIVYPSAEFVATAPNQLAGEAVLTLSHSFFFLSSFLPFRQSFYNRTDHHLAHSKVCLTISLIITHLFQVICKVDEKERIEWAYIGSHNFSSV